MHLFQSWQPMISLILQIMQSWIYSTLAYNHLSTQGSCFNKNFIAHLRGELPTSALQKKNSSQPLPLNPSQTTTNQPSYGSNHFNNRTLNREIPQTPPNILLKSLNHTTYEASLVLPQTRTRICIKMGNHRHCVVINASLQVMLRPYIGA